MQPLEKLKNLFYNPKLGLTSYKQLYEKAKENNINVSLNQVKDFYNNQEVNQIFKEKHKPLYIPISADKVGTLQADLIDMSKLASHNKNYKWILNVIDVYSRKVWSFPIKTKEPTNVLPAIKKVVADVAEVDKLTTDSGGEFKGSVSKYLKDNNFTQVFANPTDNTKLRTGMVERYHKTLLNKNKEDSRYQR